MSTTLTSETAISAFEFWKQMRDWRDKAPSTDAYMAAVELERHAFAAYVRAAGAERQGATK